MWNQVRSALASTLEWRFPQASLYARNEGEIWHTAIEYRDVKKRHGVKQLAAPPPGVYGWLSTIARSSETLALSPAMPDRSYAAEFRGSLRIVPGASVQTSLILPLNAVLSIDSGTVIAEYPLAKLSTTWFGSLDAGTHCYTLVTGLVPPERLVALVESPDPAVAICPIALRNECGSTIDIKTLPVPVDWLGLYSDGTLVGTDGLSYVYTERDGLDVKLATGRPAIRDGLELVTKPRQSDQHKLFNKGFAFLKTLKGGMQ